MKSLNGHIPSSRLQKAPIIMSIASHFPSSPLALACLAVFATLPIASARAQVAPDAGQVLREQTAPILQPPRPSAGFRLITPPAEPTLPGGATVRLQSVRVQGNSVLPEAQLLESLGDVTGQTLDMAGLRGLAEKVAETYHAAGYPFARAFLPQQNLSDGLLTIEVVEGRFGEVKTTGDAELAPQAQEFLSRLVSGAVIESATLERATLVLDDMPGVKTSPLMRPGSAFGTGNLEVDVQRTQAVRGDVGYDNHGSRYTGEHRLRANVIIDSPFMLGDQVQLNAITTSEDLWLGSLGYSLPVGTDGWRVQASYAQTHYQLGKEFASSQASGTAMVSSVGATYPWVRSQALNLTVGVNFQHKDLQDKQGAAGTQTDKRSDASVISLQFDRRDALGGGGVTYGTLSFTPGQLQLGSSLKAQDSSSGVNSDGSFNKWNLDIARMQATDVIGLSLFGRVSSQWADKNLDSSERFGLGGPNGVRAYPVGEGYGDTGWLAQLELRYAVGDFSPFAFYDAGSVRLRAKPDSLTSQPSTNQRSVGGAGVGVRYASGPWSADLAVAWRTEGGTPEADTTNRNPRAWLTATYRF